MIRIKKEERIREFIVENDKAVDVALERMAKDILRIAKVKVPRKDNTLTKSGQVEKGNSPLEYYVTFGNDGSNAQDYAAVQEAGKRSGARAFSRYTSPGTGAHYLRDAGNTVMAQSINYLKQALGRLT